MSSELGDSTRTGSTRMDGLKPPQQWCMDSPNLAKSWKSWKEEFTLYIELAMPDTEEKARVKLFYGLIGERGRELCGTIPGSEARETVNSLMKKLDDHCSPKMNEIVERYRFFVRNQAPGEPIDTYVTDLKTLASTCNFGQLTASLIRDRVVCGTYRSSWRERLLGEDNLDLDKCLQICRSMEISDVHQLMTKEEEVLPEQQERSSSVKQETPAGAAAIKEEQEEVWSSEEKEQLQGSEEAESSTSSFTSVPVKSKDDDEEGPQASRLHESQDAQQQSVMKEEQPVHVKSEDEDEEITGEECGGNDEERNPAPGRQFKPETDDNDASRKDRVYRPYAKHVKRNQFKRQKRKLSCDECGKTFRFRSLLNSHKMVHTGEKPFSCDECDKTFRRKLDVKSHKMIHSDEKPFSCHLCGSKFKRKATLTSHVWTHSEQKAFSCDECGKTFKTKDVLKHHKLVHTKEKPFSCDECGKSFKAKGALKHHKLVHTKEKPFSCDECGKSFKTKGAVKIHKMIHTMERSFMCDDCGKLFSKKCNMIQHKMVHSTNNSCS